MHMESDTAQRTFDAVNKEFLKMFIPVPDTMRKTLFEAFLAIFVSSEEEEAGRDTQPFITTGRQKVMLPGFANKLTLLLSVKNPTQKKPAAIQELNRTKLCLPGGKAWLEEHMSSTDLWDLDVEVDQVDGSWHWTLPPGGKLTMWTFNDSSYPFQQHRQSVSTL